MTTINADRRRPYARCKKCDSDLIVRTVSHWSARVFCSNHNCTHSRHAHPAGSTVNAGP